MRSLPFFLSGVVALAAAAPLSAQGRSLDRHALEQIRKIVRQEVRAAVRDAMREMHGERGDRAKAGAHREHHAFRLGIPGGEIGEQVRAVLKKARKALGDRRLPKALAVVRKAKAKQPPAKAKKKGRHVFELKRDGGQHVLIEIEKGKKSDGQPRIFVMGAGGHGKVETKAFTKSFTFPGGRGKVLWMQQIDDDEDCDDCEDRACDEDDCDEDDCDCEEHEKAEKAECCEPGPHRSAGREPGRCVEVRIRRRIHV